MHPGIKVLFQGMFTGFLMPGIFITAAREDYSAMTLCIVLAGASFWFGLTNAEKLYANK